jgi:hypothetical protein
MTSSSDERITAILKEAGLDDGKIDMVKGAIKSLPPKAYNNAVFFLGCATLVITLGGVFLIAYNKTVPDGLWTALGAGIGGLAGIFMGK